MLWCYLTFLSNDNARKYLKKEMHHYYFFWKKKNKVSKKIHKINCDHVVRQMTKEKKEYLELFLINNLLSAIK